MSQIRFEVKGWQKLGQNLRRTPEFLIIETNRLFRRIGALMVPAVKSVTPTRTRRLRNSTVFQIMGSGMGQRLEIRQGARTAGGQPYGHFVREGTAPHIIRPVRARALAFMVNGRQVFAMKVQHPGTAPNQYHRVALHIAGPQIARLVNEAGIGVSTKLANIHAGER